MSVLEKPREANGGGMPAFVPTLEQRGTVGTMAGFGIPHEDIALVIINPRTELPIDPKTLREHFRKELDTGHVIANAKVAETLYKSAVAGNITAAIWWTKARMRWSERVEHTGADGQAIEVNTTVTHRDRAKALLAVVAKARQEKA